MKVVVYTGKTPLGNEIVSDLREMSCEVIAYETKADIPEKIQEDSIDLLILVGGSEEGLPMQDGVIGTERDYDAVTSYLTDQMMIRYDLIEKYIPYLKKGCGKRIGFVSYRYASISDNMDTEDYALHMDAAGMSMLAKMVHEKYRNQAAEHDVTVRYFAAELCEDKRRKGISAAQYMMLNFSEDKMDDPRHYEENHLRMRDHKFVQIPW